MKKGIAQPKDVYTELFVSAIIALTISVILPIIFPISQPIDLLYASFFPTLTIILIVYGLRCYEKFYINNNEIIVKNCFKTLKKINLNEIKSIYISSIQNKWALYSRFNYDEYIVISTRGIMVKQDRFLNSQDRIVITIHASPINISIINEWTENKFNLYE